MFDIHINVYVYRKARKIYTSNILERWLNIQHGWRLLTLYAMCIASNTIPMRVDIYKWLLLNLPKADRMLTQGVRSYGPKTL